MASTPILEPSASYRTKPAPPPSRPLARLPSTSSPTRVKASASFTAFPPPLVQSRSTSIPGNLNRRQSLGPSSYRAEQAAAGARPSEGVARGPTLNASPDPTRRTALLGTGPGVPVLKLEDPSLDHHRSDSGRSTGSSRSNTTGESLFLTNSCRPSFLGGGHSGGEPGRRAHSDVRTRALVGSERGASLSTEARGLSQSSLMRRESWASTTPTSPEDEEGSLSIGPDDLRHKQGKPDADVQQQGPSASAAAAAAAAAQARDKFGPFWDSSNYTYDSGRRGSGRINDTSLPPLMLSDAPIPPSRSESLDPLAVSIDQDTSSSTLTIFDIYAQSCSSNTSSRKLEPLPQNEAKVAGGVGASPKTRLDDLARSPLDEVGRRAARREQRQAQQQQQQPFCDDLTSPLTPQAEDQLGQAVRPEESTSTLRSRAPSVANQTAKSTASSSSLSGSSAPASPKGQQPNDAAAAAATIATYGPRPGASLTSKSLRSAFSRSAKSFRNSLLWSGAHADQGLSVYTAFGVSSQSLRTASIPSLAPSPQMAHGHLPVPLAGSLTPCSPTRSEFSSLSVLSSREDVSSTSLAPEQQASQPRMSPHSHSPFVFCTASKTKVSSDHGPAAIGAPSLQASTSATTASGSSLDAPSSLGDAGAGNSFADPTATEVLEDDTGSRHARPRSRFGSRFSFHDQSWSRTLTSMTTEKKGTEGGRESRKPEATKTTKKVEEETREKSSGAQGMQRGRSQSAGRLEEILAAGSSHVDANAQLPSVGPKTPQSDGHGDGKLTLPLPATPLSGGLPSPDPQISPSFTASFSFLNSALWRGIEDVFVSPAESKSTSPTLARAVTADPLVPAVGVAQDRQAVERALPSVDSPSRAPRTTKQDPSSPRGYTEPASAAVNAREAPSSPPSPLVARNGLELSSRGSHLEEQPATNQRKPTHRKQKSLDSATVITRAAKAAAADIDARAKLGDAGPTLRLPHQRSPSLAGGMTASTTMASYMTASSSALFSPGDESTAFFDALTSPAGEMPPSTSAVSARSTMAFAPSQAPSREVSAEYFPAVSLPTMGPDTGLNASIAAHWRQRSFSRTLSVVLDPLTARSRPASTKSRPSSIKGPSSPVRSMFDALEGHRSARPETSLGFSFRKALRRERKLSSGNAAAAAAAIPALTSGSTKASQLVVRRGEGSMSEATGDLLPSGAGQDRPGASKVSSAPTLPRVQSASEVTRVAPFSNRTPTKRTPTAHLAADNKTPTTPNKLRVESDPAFPLRAKSRSSSKALSSPSSYRAPLPRPLTASSSARTAAAGDRDSGEAVPRLSECKHHAGVPSKTQAAASPPTMERYAAVDEPSPKMQSRIAASRPARSTHATMASASDKSAPSLASSSSANTVTSRSSGVKKKSTMARSASQNEACTAQATAPARRAVAARRERTKSKPMLPSIKTNMDGVLVPLPPRSASSLDLRSSQAGRRKMSQPTLDIADDKEFLEALEQVRAVNRERIAAEAAEAVAEADKQARLAKLGMLSGLHLRTTKPDHDNQVQANPRGRTLSRPASSLSMASRRSASASARLGPEERSHRGDRRSIDEVQRAIVRANADRKPVLTTAVSGLEWGVGKASGKLRDGAFLNDDDWKKEVKALFLIRELVQTERSYSRHLASLLTVVSKLSITAAASTATLAKRKTGGNLFSTYSPGSAPQYLPGTLPQHLATLRTFLPQLIALSRGLINRVEANPTSAGVGAAFEILGPQLQATFVNWSAIIPDLMQAVRTAEGPKAKAALKLGLIPLLPPDQTEVGASTGQHCASPPASPTKTRTAGVHLPMDLDRATSSGPAVKTKISMPPPPPPVKSDRRVTDGKLADGATTTGRTGKRRSTVTSTTFDAPHATSALGTKRAGSNTRPASPTAEPLSRLPSRPTSPWGQIASLTIPRSSASYAKSAANPTSTPHATPVSAKTPHGQPFGSTSTANGPALPTGVGAVKNLSPMDIVIMPTQRLPRYGLMLRDLLSNTPPQSLSHARVQRALGSVQRIAMLCDAASSMAASGRNGADARDSTLSTTSAISTTGLTASSTTTGIALKR